MPEHKLSEQDMVDILEDIAENAGNAAARIAAIKVLREIRAGEQSVGNGFAALDGPLNRSDRSNTRLKAV